MPRLFGRMRKYFDADDVPVPNQIIELTKTGDKSAAMSFLRHALPKLPIDRCFYICANNIGAARTEVPLALTSILAEYDFSAEDIIFLDYSSECDYTFSDENIALIRRITNNDPALLRRIVIASQTQYWGRRGASMHAQFSWVPLDQWPYMVWEAHSPLPVRTYGYDNLEKKRFRFLCLNRKLRSHRFLIAHLLQSRDMAAHAFVSNINDIQGPKALDPADHRAELDKIKSEMPLFSDFVDQVGQGAPFESTGYLEDPGNATMHAIRAELKLPKKALWDSHVVVVNESHYQGGFSRLTEKTYKVFPYHRPFIIVGPPYSLAYLRDQGYQTFAPFIDESYDMINDHEVRMQYLFSEIKRLKSTLSEPKPRGKFIDGLRRICTHNARHFRKNFEAEMHARAFDRLRFALTRDMTPGL